MDTNLEIEQTEKFKNFDPNIWTDQDTEKWTDLWSKYGSIVDSSMDIVKKIKSANELNVSLKNEIEVSAKRCNEIKENEPFISVDSSKEIVELSKNIREIRKQQDEVEMKIAEYGESLKEYRSKEKEIINEINELCDKVQGKKEENHEPIKGKIKIKTTYSKLKFPKTISSNSNIIDTAKTATIVLKSEFEKNSNRVFDIEEFLKNRINECTFISNIQNLTKNEIQSKNIIDERNKNHLAALEAIDLANETTSELNTSSPGISIDYINNNIENNEEELLDDNKEIPEKVEPLSLEENKDKDNEVVRPLFNINNVSVENEKQENEKVEPIIMNGSNIESVTPLKLNVSEEVTPIGINKEVTSDTKNIVDIKKNNIANAKPDRINTINQVYQNKIDISEDLGISTAESLNGLNVYNVNDKLKSVANFKEYNSKNEQVVDVGNIFGNNEGINGSTPKLAA